MWGFYIVFLISAIVIARIIRDGIAWNDAIITESEEAQDSLVQKVVEYSLSK